MRIKIFLADDHELFRQGIRALLDLPEIEIIGEANSGNETLKKLKNTFPDVLLLDINMSMINGIDCARKIREGFPKVKIVVFTMHNTEEDLVSMINTGVKGYVLKTGCRAELVYAINRVANGGMYVSSEFILNKLSSIKSATDNACNVTTELKISDRELEILKLIVKGYTNSEIANKLFASVRTIETRRKKLLDKTKTSNMAMLAHFATLNGLV